MISYYSPNVAKELEMKIPEPLIGELNELEKIEGVYNQERLINQQKLYVLTKNRRNTTRR